MRRQWQRHQELEGKKKQKIAVVAVMAQKVVRQAMQVWHGGSSSSSEQRCP
jgi:hypothetical protein